MLTLEIPKGSILGPALALCQQDGAAGLYSQCMTGFIQSLSGRYEEARSSFDRKVSYYRQEAVSSTLQARTPEIVCSLQAGFEMFLEFAVSTAAIDTGEAGLLMEQCWRRFEKLPRLWEEDKRNPVSKTKIGKKRYKNERRILSFEETARVLEHLEEPNRLIIETCIATGARISEVLGLQWEHVDVDASTIKN